MPRTKARGLPFMWASALPSSPLVTSHPATKETEAQNTPLDVQGGDGLKPSRSGKRIHFYGTRGSVTDGPSR